MNVDNLRTKQGYVMNLKLRARIVMVMAESEGMTLDHVAGELGINRRTLQDYLTKDVRTEIKAKRAASGVTMDDVDKAMMAQACAGNVAAARLVYMRMAQRGQSGPLPTLDDMEAELLRLKRAEFKRKGVGDGEGVDAGDAVGVDAAG